MRALFTLLFLVLTFSSGFVPPTISPATANIFGHINPDSFKKKRVAKFCRYCGKKRHDCKCGGFDDTESVALAVPETSPIVSTFRYDNFGATLDPGEAALYPAMKKTIWGLIEPTTDERIVIHTVGSQYDTLLAVYQGTDYPNFVKVASNDNVNLPGVGTTASLVQFTAKAGKKYYVQIGSKTGDEEDVTISLFRFPPAGGLSGYLANFEGGDYQGRDYSCVLNYGGGIFCPSATFVLHNSSTRSMQVTSDTNLDDAFRLPAPVTIPAGGTKVVEFTYDPTFDDTTVRTVAGYFTFQGRTAGTLVSGTSIPAVVVVKPRSSYVPDVLKVSVDHQVRSGFMGEQLPFNVKITNSGAFTAKGCHVRSDQYSWLSTDWRSTSPARPEHQAVDIAPQASATLNVKVISIWSRGADPISLGEIIIECANMRELTFDLSNRFDVTAWGLLSPAEALTTQITPPLDTLNVPAGGRAVFRVKAVNSGPAATLVARPRYQRPFDDTATNRRFLVSVCRTASANSACLAPAAASVSFNAAVNATNYFQVIVRPPAVNPGFNPGQRRVFLDFEQEIYPDSPEVLVGTESVAVKRN